MADRLFNSNLCYTSLSCNERSRCCNQARRNPSWRQPPLRDQQTLMVRQIANWFAPVIDIIVALCTTRIRFLGYTGVSWVLSFPTFILTIISGIGIWRSHKTHQHLSRELCNFDTGPSFSPIRSVSSVSNGPPFPAKPINGKPCDAYVSSTGRVVPCPQMYLDSPKVLLKHGLSDSEQNVKDDTASDISSIIFSDPPPAILEPEQRFERRNNHVDQGLFHGNFYHLLTCISFLSFIPYAQTFIITHMCFLSLEGFFQVSGVLLYSRCKSQLHWTWDAIDLTYIVYSVASLSSKCLWYFRHLYAL